MISEPPNGATLAGLKGKQLDELGVKFCATKVAAMEEVDRLAIKDGSVENERGVSSIERPKKELVLSIGSAASNISDEMIDCQRGEKAIKLAAENLECEQKHPADGHKGDISEPIRTTRKRYAILLMFVVLHTVKSFQWICLASITNTVASFYGVDNLAINWTTILFMVTFLVLALPVSWIMDTIGLRSSALIGSIGVTSGVCIKCFSCTRDGFAISMLGHLLVGITEPFFFSSYAQVASTWFPDHQVAMATSASLIGEQTGLALGFIIPPLMVGNDPNDFEAIQAGLHLLFVAVALICLINTCCMILFFDAKPKFAPGVARQRQLFEEKVRRQSLCLSSNCQKQAQGQSNLIDRGRRMSRRMSQSLGEQMKLSSKFVTNKHFILLLIGFGINMGISYSLHTLLNQMVMRPTAAASNIASLAPMELANGSYKHEPQLIATLDGGPTLFPKWQAEETSLIVGNAGLILIIAGLIGSALCGFLLDRYHRYKLTAASFYLASLLSLATMTVCLLLQNELLLYLVTIPLGFALTGYASCAFDYGVEITYPKPELLSSTLLNISAQLFGIPISLAGSLIVDNYGSQALGTFLCAILLTGFIVTLLQGGSLRRQEAVRGGALKGEPKGNAVASLVQRPPVSQE